MSGAPAALLNLVLALRERGHECAVMLPDSGGALPKKLKAAGIRMFAEQKYSLSIYPRCLNPLKRRRRRKKLEHRELLMSYMGYVLDCFGPDIVHTNVGPLDFAAEACRLKGIPHVWHLREYQDLDFGMKFYPSQEKFMEMIHGDWNRCIAITSDIFSHFRLGRRDRVIYDGVFDEREFGEKEVGERSAAGQERKMLGAGYEARGGESHSDESGERHSDESGESHSDESGGRHSGESERRDAGWSGGRKYFLYAARIEKAKGFDILARAFRKFAPEHEGWQLIVAGRPCGLYAFRWKLFCRRHLPKGSVKFLGQSDRVAELMRGAAATVVPSRFEAFGFTTAEAMLLGCTVIGRNTAGTREQFDNGLRTTGREIGLRFGGDGPQKASKLSEQLCARMNEVADLATEQGEKELDAMHAAAKKTVVEYYGACRCARQVEELYSEILAEK